LPTQESIVANQESFLSAYYVVPQSHAPPRSDSSIAREYVSFEGTLGNSDYRHSSDGNLFEKNAEAFHHEVMSKTQLRHRYFTWSSRRRRRDIVAKLVIEHRGDAAPKFFKRWRETCGLDGAVIYCTSRSHCHCESCVISII